MKKTLTMMLAVLLCTAGFAKDNIKTLVVTTTPQMHCASCEKKIKENIRFEKGVKEIETNIGAQTVTIKYDAAKNSPEKLMQAFGKFGYKASEVTPADKVDSNSGPQGKDSGGKK